MDTTGWGRTNTFLQSYVLLTPEQMHQIGKLFDICDRDDINKAVQMIVDAYIAEHKKDDAKKLQSQATWDAFATKFDEGWFDDRLSQKVV